MSKKMLLLVSVFVVTSLVTASAAMIDDFESYADTAAMTAVWMDLTGSPEVSRTLSATGGVGGSQAMHWLYGGPPPNTAWWVFSGRFLNASMASEDWSGHYGEDFSVSYKAASLSSNYEPLNGGMNAEIVVYNSANTCIQRTTEWITVSPNWQQISIDIESGNEQNGSWTDVLWISVGISPETWLEADIMFDDVLVTPEPATMLLLSLGGLLIRRRR